MQPPASDRPLLKNIRLLYVVAKVLVGAMVPDMVGHMAPCMAPHLSFTRKESTREGRALSARPSVVEAVVVDGEMYVERIMHSP